MFQRPTMRLHTKVYDTHRGAALVASLRYLAVSATESYSRLSVPTQKARVTHSVV